MAYLKAKIEQETEELTYKVYSSDALKAITENTERFNGGSHMGRRWIDLADGEEDKRSGEEIAEDIINRAGLIRGGGE